jgi:predicted nucleic acid-binding Zn ribbon protein
MEKMSDVFCRIKKSHVTLKTLFNEQDAIACWRQAVGHPMNKHVIPVKCEQNRLFLKVDHSLWHHDCRQRKNQLLSILYRLLEERGATLLEDIIILAPYSNRSHLRHLAKKK